MQKKKKSFCGAANYLSIFCRHLQELLKPIYDLTREGRPFVWQEEQQQAFDTIKRRMINPPQFCICLNLEEDLSYTVIHLGPIQVVPYGKYKKGNLDS